MSEDAPPLAPRRPTTHERFGTVWTDDYAWLRDPAYPEVNDPEIRAYLDAENAYFERFMAPHAALVERLHAEMKGRIKEDDRSVPVREGAFEYHWQFFPGAQYRTWFRRAPSEPEPVVILDEREPGSFDPLAAMRRKLSDDIVKSRFHILELERHRNRVRQHIDRLGRKAGTDFLGSMLRARSQSITEAIRNAEGQIQAIEQAYAMLEGYSYELAAALEPVKGEAAE